MFQSNRQKVGSNEKAYGWENLDFDILLMILLNYFNIHELTSGVAQVCRRWRAVCCEPILWNTIDLSHMKSTYTETPVLPYVYVERQSDKELTRLLKRCMNLSKGNTRTLIFGFYLFPNADMITYTLGRCRNLRRLVLPGWKRVPVTCLCNAISLCKNLESLTMQPPIFVSDLIFKAIGNNCKNFRELKIMGPIYLIFAKNLVKYLPKLKILSVRCTAIDDNAFMEIVCELKSLEVFNISHSYIVERDTSLELVTMYKKASKLKKFITCKEIGCLICEKTIEFEDKIDWPYRYEEDLWKTDEVSSLHL